MEPGIMLYVGCRTDVYEQIKTLSDIGVRRTFINAKHPELDSVLRAVKEAGMICDNLHSEYNGTFGGVTVNMDDVSREGPKGDIMLSRILGNIDKCAQHNIPLIVVHPSNAAPELAVNKFAEERYTAIGNYARKNGVEVAFENIIYTENLEYIMSLVPDAKFCWDCGHEYSRLKGSRPMPLFGKRLAALHIHDNFFTHDKHLIPFTGKIDFDVVGRQLAEVGYDGTLMLEIMYGGNEENSAEPTYRDYALKAKSAAERVIGIVEKYKTQ